MLRYPATAHAEIDTHTLIFSPNRLVRPSAAAALFVLPWALSLSDISVSERTHHHAIIPQCLSEGWCLSERGVAAASSLFSIPRRTARADDDPFRSRREQQERGHHAATFVIVVAVDSDDRHRATVRPHSSSPIRRPSVSGRHERRRRHLP